MGRDFYSNIQILLYAPLTTGQSLQGCSEVWSAVYAQRKSNNVYQVCWYVLQKSGSNISRSVSDDRRQSDVEWKGVVVLCICLWRGTKPHDRL